MFESLKKYMSENTGLLIRLDDIAENMNWEMMNRATVLFDKLQILPVLGVVPKNTDSELLAYPKGKINFWDQVRIWKNKGWEIGMHGFNHRYDKFCKKTDYLGHGGNTEFCDHPYEMQLQKITEGLKKFNSENIKVRTFFAPNHTFDHNTLKALNSAGINEIVDGYGLMPYEENEIKFIPQLFYKLIALPFGIQALQVHLNYFTEKDFNSFQEFLEKNSKKIISYDYAISKINNKLNFKIARVISKKVLQFKRLIK